MSNRKPTHHLEGLDPRAKRDGGGKRTRFGARSTLRLQYRLSESERELRLGLRRLLESEPNTYRA